jgi:hypothetical protein
MRTVAIVGNGRTRDQAPHDDMGLDIWTMNNHAMLWEKRTTAVFEMHPDAAVTDRYTPEYRHWLQLPHKFPIYMHEALPAVPASITYPLAYMFYGREIQKGKRKVKHFYTTTPPYMLALALHLHYQRVELYGIDMENEERQAHRDSVFFWIGVLAASGVELYLPEESALMDEWLYPINTPPPPRKRRL